MTRKTAWLAGGMGLVLAIAAAKLLLHLATASRYGYFGDELYFLACGAHLDWGYVDHPPLIGLAAWAVRHTLGDSLLAIRSVSAVAGALLVVLTGLLAREMGGGRFAMGLAALASGLGFVHVVLHYLFTMNAFDLLFWAGTALVVVRIVTTGDQRLWLAFGLLAGLGLQSKYTIAVWGLGVVVGVSLSPERKAFRRPWIWLGGALAFLVFLPNLAWNLRHGFPFLEFLRSVRESGRDVALAPVEYVLHQVLNMNPASLPVWGAGLRWLLLAPRGRPFRPLGTAFLVTLAVFVATKGKDYYVVPAFAPLLAAGGVALESATREGRRRALRPVLVLLFAASLPLLPLGLPLLEPDRLIAYQQRIGFAPPATEVAHARAALPHHFAWQFGWDEMVATVALVYRAMPPEEQARVAIVGNNYGQSGALDLLGPKYGLPMKAIGTHQSYWLWGPGEPGKDVLIVVGDRPERLRQWCEDVEVAAERFHPWTAVWENGPVLVCRRPRYRIEEVWPKVRNWG